MILKDVLEKAATLLGLSLNFDQNGEEQLLLVDCGKDTIMRVSNEFCDIKSKQKVVSVAKKIPYTDFEKSVKCVLKIIKDDEKQSFLEEANGIKVDFDGEAEVTYSYFVYPNDKNSVIDLPPRYSINLLALGVAGEYCYRKGYYKEGETYDARFAGAMENVTKDVKNVTLKEVRI